MSLFNTVAYLTPDDANDYFAGRTVSDAWDDATVDDQTRALLDATRRINRLNFAGLRTADYNARTGCNRQPIVIAPENPDQPLEFPRNGSTTIPEDILVACCEIAYALLDGVDPEVETQNLGTVHQGFAAVRETYDPAIAKLAFRHGIPSYTAWSFLWPYLQSPMEVSLRRVS